MAREPHLLEEAVLLVRDGRGRLRELAALLPEPRPHVLLLQEGVELRQGVQDLLGGRERGILPALPSPCTPPLPNTPQDRKSVV